MCLRGPCGGWGMGGEGEGVSTVCFGTSVAASPRTCRHAPRLDTVTAWRGVNMSCGDLRSLSQITEEKKKPSECNWEKRRRRRRRRRGRSPGPTCSYTQCVARTTKTHDREIKGRGGGGGGGGGGHRTNCRQQGSRILRPAGLSKVARESREETEGWRRKIKLAAQRVKQVHGEGGGGGGGERGRLKVERRGFPS